MQPLAKTVATALLFVVIACAHGQESPSRVTILYDAFGKQSPLKRGWLFRFGGVWWETHSV